MCSIQDPSLFCFYQGKIRSAVKQNSPSFCDHCGAKLSGREKFCPECGQIILESPAAFSMAQTAPTPSAAKEMSLDEVINKALEYENKKEYENALKLLLDSLSSNSEEPRLYNRIGSVYKNMGNHNKAIEFYKKAMEIEPSATRYNNLALAYESQGSLYEELFYMLETMKRIQMVESDKDKGVMYANYGRIIGILGDLHGAKSNLIIANSLGYSKEECERYWNELLWRK